MQDGHLEEDDPEDQHIDMPCVVRSMVKLVSRKQVNGRPARKRDQQGGNTANKQTHNSRYSVEPASAFLPACGTEIPIPGRSSEFLCFHDPPSVM